MKKVEMEPILQLDLSDSSFVSIRLKISTSIRKFLKEVKANFLPRETRV